MKKLSTIMLVVLTLLTSSFSVYAQESTPLALQERINRKDLNVVSAPQAQYIDKDGKEVTSVNQAISARLHYEFELTEEESSLVQEGDTYTFAIEEMYEITEETNGSLSEFGSFSLNSDQTVTLTFNKQSAETIKGNFEFLAGVKQGHLEPSEPVLPTENEPQELAETVDPVAPEASNPEDTQETPDPSKPMSIFDRLGRTERVISKLTMVVGNEDLTIDSTLMINVAWDLLEFESDTNFPERPTVSDILEGDFYEFQLDLPKGLKFTKPQSNVLEGGLGTYTVSETGLVRLTFSSDLASIETVMGDFEIQASFDEEFIKEPGLYPIKLPFSDEEEFELNVKPKGPKKTIEKSGKANLGGKNSSEITWDVIINKGYDTLSNVVVKDTLPPGLSQVGVVEVYAISYDLEGNEIGEGQLLKNGKDYTTTDGSTVTFDSINTPYRLVYKSKIDEKIVEGIDEKSINFTNEAILKSKELGTLDTTASVGVYYGALLKKSEGNFVRKDNEIKWSIKYNDREQVKNKPVLVDTFDERLEFKDGSLKISLTNDPKTVLTENVDYVLKLDPTSSTFTIEFLHEIKDSYVIDYVTKVKDTVIVTKDTDFKNTVSTESTESSGNGSVASQMLFKNHGKMDYANDTMDWTINLNLDKYTIEDGIVTDTFRSGGMTLEKNEDLKVFDVTNGVYLQEGKDYTLTINGTPDQTGFTLEFKPFSSELRIDYVTKIDPDKVSIKDNYKHLVNFVLFEGKANGNIFEAGRKVEYKLRNEYKNNGVKSGSYNPTNKKITWTIVVNYTGETLKNASLNDVLLPGLPIDNSNALQEFVPGSLKIETVSVQKDGSIINPQEVNDLTNFTITEPDLKGANTLNIGFPDGSTSTYRVTFETSLDGYEIANKYENKSTFTNDDQVVRNLDASVSIAHGGELLNKFGVQNEDIVNWTIMINRSQSTIYEAQIKDEPSNNQILDEKSFRLYGTTVQSNGEVVKDTNKLLTENQDYVFVIETDHVTGIQVFTIAFTREFINEAYILEYQSVQNIIDHKDNVLKNKVTLTGKNLKLENQGGESNLVINVDGSSGSGSGVSQTYTLTKNDEQGIPLEGVVFELYNKNNRLVSKQTTDAKGQITFHRIVSGNYTLKEISTKEGFVISSDLYNGVLIPVSRTDASLNVGTFINKRNKLTLTKVDENGRKITGALFTLRSADGTPIKENFELGTMVFESLPAGIYTLTETKAADGYLLNTQVQKIELKKDENGQLIDVRKNFTNYKGTFSLTKVGFDNKPLAGVKFSLFDEKGTPLSQNHTSNASGVVTIKDLSPGNYYVVETDSSQGHIVNPEKIHFTILDKTEGKPATAKPKNIDYFKNIKGSVELTKVDENNTLLQGVTFRLYTDKGEALSLATTDKNGVVRFENIGSGSYYLQEETPLAGYVKNTTQYPFSIISNLTEGDPHFVINTKAINYKGSIALNKKGFNNDPLKGVEFELYTDKHVQVGSTYTTDAKGTLTVTDLAPGTYYFKETKTVNGHILNTNTFEFKIDSEAKGKPAIETIDVTNYKGSVSFIKTDAQGNALENAEFTLFTKDGVKVGNYVSNELGRVFVKDLSVGEYYFQEVKAPNGFLINTAKITFEIDAESAQGIINLELDAFVNYKGSFTLTKTDYKHDLLEGAVFDLYRKDNTPISTGHTTLKDGTLTLSELAPGDYYLLETQSNNGNIIDTNKVSFTIKASAENTPAPETKTVQNIRGSVQLVKQDEKSSPLEGVVYALLDSDGTEQRTTSSTDQGIVRFDDLEPGTYFLQEKTPLKGFIKDTTKHEFTIADRTSESVVLEDLGTVTNYKGSVRLKKVGIANRVLKGVEFELLNELKKPIRSIYATDADGQILISDLEPGTYFFKEVKTVEGYILHTEDLKFTVSNENEGEPTLIEITATNFKGSVSFTKTDVEGNPLKGSEFKLYTVDGTEVDVPNPLISDENGIVSATNLSVGSYYFEEVKATDGYAINTIKHDFEIIASTEETSFHLTLKPFVNHKGSVELVKYDYKQDLLSGAKFDLYQNDETLVSKDHTTDLDGRFVITELAPGEYYFLETESSEGNIVDTNKIKFIIEASSKNEPLAVQTKSNNTKASVEFYKKDITNNPISDVEFTLYNVDDATEITRVLSDVNGLVRVDQLAPGNYVFKETQAKEGFILNTADILFTVDATTTESVVLIELEDFINYTGTVEISKVDINGNLIEEAQFAIYDADNKRIALEWTKSGILTLEGLAPGNYTVTEVSAPQGFILDETPHSFTIVSENKGAVETVKLAIINERIVPPTEEPRKPKLPDTGINKAYTIEMGLALSALGTLLIAIKQRRKKQA